MMLTRDDISRVLRLSGSLPEVAISSVTEDSRRVTPGALFVAVSGEKADGHAYIGAAREAGASAVLGNRPGMVQGCPLPYIHHHNPRQAAALLAHALAGDPSRTMCVVGITGTNGKTSTTFLIQRILQLAGYPCCNFGTLGYDLGDAQVEAAHTTPFGEDLAALFAQASRTEARHVVMEVSSHALAQERVAGISFNVGAFTNLTQDHLDYHEDMTSYLESKLKLFAHVRETYNEGAGAWPCFTVVNQEDAYASHFAAVLSEACIRYGHDGQVRAEKVALKNDSTEFTLITPWGVQDTRIHLVGVHNVLNALCAAAIGGGLGVPIETIAAGLEALLSVPGRFEPVVAGQEFQVIVDYAHTDDGLRNALQAARAICDKRILCVFGCGGDRDTSKRPKMGAVAAELADYVVVTSDNPRTEDPYRILLDVEVGLQRSGKKKNEDYVVIESRREAIFHAIGQARPGDLVLIAGKGHETYQILGMERIHFDDREQAREALEEITS